MKLLLENWREFLKEAHGLRGYIRGQMGYEKNLEKWALLRRFPELKKISGDEEYQLIQVLLYPDQKPMYYTVDNEVPDGFSEEFLSFVEEQGLEIAQVTNPQTCGRNEAIYIGIPENVRKAAELSNTPFIGIENLGFEEEFLQDPEIQALMQKYGAGFCVSPEYHYQMGILLGYGEESAAAFAEKQKQRWHSAYDEYMQRKQWKTTDDQPTVALEETA